MQLVRSGLGSEVRYGSLAAGVLSAHRAGLELEFTDGFSRRAELAVRAAGQIHAADGDTVDQDLVRIILATINGSLPCAACRAGQGSKDELLDLPAAATDGDRPGIEFFFDT